MKPGEGLRKETRRGFQERNQQNVSGEKLENGLRRETGEVSRREHVV